MSFTYSQLKNAVQDYAENDESTFVSNLPIFIKNTEERILKNIQLTFFRKTTTVSMTASQATLSKPSDFLAPHSFSITLNSGEKSFLDYKDVDYVQTLYPDSTQGVPKHYAFLSIDQFIVGPVPDSNYSTEIQYFYRPASLTAGAEDGTSWLSENAPMTMLYGALVEAYTYMKGEQDMLQLYMQQFMQGLQGLKLFGEAKEVTDQYRTGMVIRPKQ
jgi:hypothetical protein